MGYWSTKFINGLQICSLVCMGFYRPPRDRRYTHKEKLLDKFRPNFRSQGCSQFQILTVYKNSILLGLIHAIRQIKDNLPSINIKLLSIMSNKST